MTDLQSEIANNAQGPAEARGDSGSVRQHGLSEQIAADRYLAAKGALRDSTKPHFGLRIIQLVAPGAI